MKNMTTSFTNELMYAAIFSTILFFIFTVFSISYLLIFRKKRKKHHEEIDTFKKEFQRQLLQSQIEVQEYTYNALSKELHDNVGQLLSTSRMLLGLTERNLPNPPDTLLTANATLGDAISELRSLSKSLDREWLEQFSFANNLATEITRINNTGTLRITATFKENYTLPLRSEEQIILFRIVQEAIQNAIKHAQAKDIHISIKGDGQALYIHVDDDGKGFSPGATLTGMGLLNMKHRTTLLGGTIQWQVVPNAGTSVQIVIPEKNSL